MDALVWESLMLSLVRLHLNNEVHKVFWLGEEFELLGIDKVSELDLDLNTQLNDIETVEAVVSER